MAYNCNNTVSYLIRRTVQKYHTYIQNTRTQLGTPYSTVACLPPSSSQFFSLIKATILIGLVSDKLALPSYEVIALHAGVLRIQYLLDIPV
ncbi:hypothetical protein T310_1470 [Rasamsonia emersonii CBS 393.64]|uniref:Uncharacterized protein n=1 Tax=Rasamsonia emersonii (strain ATCC 16479 / CBS 393.64 / IMI 116815) TaxID=1408163 RepID=A0A0F4Z2X1_RASE3|nr:hypothetical protein T310_1470 [Rasamsonia emersonii CBS 393.64]KKA24441.1 hypothetical protein T310_1470 [Rasamsonia emersonii CBS 393.64]